MMRCVSCEGEVACVAGKMVYHGPREDILPFFAQQGMHCPERKADSDFLQEVTSRKDQKVGHKRCVWGQGFAAYPLPPCLGEKGGGLWAWFEHLADLLHLPTHLHVYCTDSQAPHTCCCSL